ncbi:hypothetical protein [Streptomyces sp. NPDC003514]
MIKIEYPQTGTYVQHGREHLNGMDLATTKGAELRWYYFLSDLTFAIDEAELSPPWSWTPVFDFLWSMKGALEHLERGERTTISFTENAELISFVPDGESVRVSCTYASAEAVCTIVDLRSAWRGLRETVLTRLIGDHPRLAANPVLAELQL